MDGADLTSSESDDRYLFGEKLIQSGYGEVWVAQDTRLNQTVVIKKIDKWFSDQPRALDALRAEVIAGRRIASAHVLRIFDLERINRHDCLVMEHLEGCTLGVYLKNEKPSPLLAKKLVLQLCLGLSAMHECGFAHRDLTPQNVMVDDSGKLVIIDLGMAGILDRSPQIGPYQAPELLPSLILADIYALGGLLSLIGGAVGYSPPCIDSPWLDPIVSKCRLSQPEQRYASVREILNVLDDVQLEPKLPSRPRRLLKQLVALCSLTILISVSVFEVRPSTHSGAVNPSEHFFVMPGSDDSRSQMLADLISLYLEKQNVIVSHLTRRVDLRAHQLASVPEGSVISVESTPEPQSTIRLTFTKSGDLVPPETLLKPGNHLPIELLSKVAEKFGLARPDSLYDFALDGYTLNSFESAWQEASIGTIINARRTQCKPSISLPVILLRAKLDLLTLARKKTQVAVNCATISIDQLQAKESVTSEAALLRAALFKAEGGDEDAVNALQSSAGILSTKAPIYRALSEMALKQGFGQEAIRWASLAMQMDPFVAENYITGSRAEIAEGDDAKALSFLNTALSLDSRSEKALAALGGLYIRTGKFQDAKASLERAVEIKSSPEAITLLGLANILCGNTQQGVLLLAGAAAKNPTLQSLATLGAALRWTGESEKSITTLQQALDFGNDSSTDGIELGKMAMVYAQLGHLSKADRMIRNAGKYMSPLNTDLLYCSMVVDAFADRSQACVRKFRLLKERRFLVALALKDPKILAVLGNEVR